MLGKPEDRVGTQIAERYRLDQVIGAGGMGVVYRGVHLGTGRAVAVKLLLPGSNEISSARFLREARAAASVRHPHLVEVLDVGEEPGGAMYLVLELLEGESLYAHLHRKGPMGAEAALEVVVPILDALQALHDAGVLHRDVKPDNIFLALEGGAIVPTLLDLGISKPLERGDVGLTRTGTLIGTPTYMSPEQARGSPHVGIEADVWAVGVVLFECLRGEPPFSAETVAGMLHKIATQRPASLVGTMPELPRPVGEAVDRALAHDAADRHPTAREFADALVEAALAAGWSLACRTPSGPRISLEPPVGSRAVGPSLPDRPSSPSAGSISLDPTLEATEAAVSGPARATFEPSDEAGPDGTLSRGAADAAASLPVRSLWPAAAAVVVLVLAAIGLTLAYGGAGDEPPERAIAPSERLIVAGPPEEPADAGVAVPLEEGVDVPDVTPAVTGPTEAVPRVPPSRRAERRPPRVREVVSPPPRSSGVELGANAAPIIVD